MTDKTIDTPPFADHFDSLAGDLPGAGLDWLGKLRQAGRDRYSATGVPTPREERWRYTNLHRPLTRTGFAPAGATMAAPDGVDLAIPQDAVHSLVFVDGRFRADLSALGALPAGAYVGSLAALLADDPARVEALLGSLADAENRPLIALNTALMSDGLVIDLPDGVAVPDPIHVVSVGGVGGAALSFHQRTLVRLRSGATATLVERSAGVAGSVYFANAVLEADVGTDAVFNHYRIQEESAEAFHVTNGDILLAKGSTYDGFVLSLGGRISRNEIHTRLTGEGIDCRLSGAYMMRGEQHTDTSTLIEHQAPGCTSRQVYKGVLDDKARGVFQGKIHVHRPAQQTDGYQMNRALLLSEAAEIDSKPELEIYADDVKCSHGATVGDLDPEALFYLQSRGVPLIDARRLMITSFLAEAIDEVDVEHLRAPFEATIVRWLDGIGS